MFATVDLVPIATRVASCCATFIGTKPWLPVAVALAGGRREEEQRQTACAIVRVRLRYEHLFKCYR